MMLLVLYIFPREGDTTVSVPIVFTLSGLLC
jgi:hypothetical protein